MWPKYILFEPQKYRGIIFHSTEELCKFWRKTDLWFEKRYKKFGKFYQSTWKCQNWIVNIAAETTRKYQAYQVNTIPDNDLENTVISICRDSGVEIDPKDIEGCHRHSLSRNSRGKIKKWLSNLSTGSTRKPYLETKNGLVVGALIIWMSRIKFLSRYPFAHITDIYGVSARIYKGKTR